MSTIKLEIEVSAENVSVVSQFLQAIAGSAKAKKTEVVDAEEVKAPAAAKAPTPRPSRAKPKAPPVEEEEVDDDFSEDDEDDNEEDETSEITSDDIRAVQATKIDKNREALKAQYKKLGATGISSLAPENYQKMYDFLVKLK